MRHAAWRLRASRLVLTLVLAAGCKRAPQEAPPAAPEAASAVHADSVIEYRNTALGFGVTLPRSWRGFSVRDSSWSGDSSGVTVAKGRKVVVVHPDATAEHPRQGIPILVFTTEQWNRLRADAWHIGAAPIG
ncbi:MAG: hypothetical protein ABJC19_11170, partial [Gemmatimonadota bacterium]